MEQDFKKEKYWKYVEEFVTELKTAKYWLKNDGKPLPEWKLFETRSAARDAAGDAAGDAARDAARDAAWDAAWDAAGDAAGDAARDAAWNAAGDAARDAAWNTAWSATWDAAKDAVGDAAVFARMLVCLDLNIEFKHLAHLNARMEVWRKGYGLYCEVDGVLYVYKVCL